MTIKNALIVDVETTGVDQDSTVIEIGAVLYSVGHNTTLAQVSYLPVPINDNPAVHANGIPAEATRGIPDSIKGISEKLFVELIENSDVVVAHNAEFDRQFLVECQQKDWVCTMNDFIWPVPGLAGKSLVSVALAHGVGVSKAHRALTDCQLIADLFGRMSDLPEMFAAAMRPKALFRAIVSFDDRQLAKDAGFKWEADTKSWVRTMAIDDTSRLPFPVKKLRDIK